MAVRTQQSIISIFSTEFVKQIKKFKVNVKGGFAVGFLDVFISEGAPEAGGASEGEFFRSRKS